jgi:glycosyltransferase involved in cell wall biosynthesis
MKKVALIVQRYGQEVNGGAEYHCRELAEHLTPNYHVTVLTNCAVDHEDWDNYYQPGRDLLNGVEIIRFKNESKRMANEFVRWTRKLRKKRYKVKGLRGKFYRLLGTIDGKSLSRIRKEWFRTQGPYCPDLISYLREHHSDYDKLIFFTYLYYPTAMGIDVAPGKSILIPTAHDEPEIYLPVFTNVFTKPGYILYNSHSEKALVERLFRNSNIPNQVVGIGINTADRFIAKEEIKEVDFADPYFVYIGRVESGKNVDQLVELFLSYKAAFPSNVKLIFIGKGSLKIDGGPHIITMGFVDEEVKSTLLLNAIGLVIPSKFESLSMVTLESMALGVPVVANGACEVLKDHIEMSRAGLVYEKQEEFNLALETLRNKPDIAMRDRGREYVKKNYSWTNVLNKISIAIEDIQHD